MQLRRRSFFFFNDTATTEIYTLSLHDALPICLAVVLRRDRVMEVNGPARTDGWDNTEAIAITDVRSEEHTSELQSPVPISYAVFCLKKKNKKGSEKKRDAMPQ